MKLENKMLGRGNSMTFKQPLFQFHITVKTITLTKVSYPSLLPGSHRYRSSEHRGKKKSKAFFFKPRKESSGFHSLYQTRSSPVWKEHGVTTVILHQMTLTWLLLSFKTLPVTYVPPNEKTRGERCWILCKDVEELVVAIGLPPKTGFTSIQM